MISDEDRLSILRDYATGVITRTRTMGLLEMTWYGDLLDSMNEAGLTIVLPEDVRETMRKSLEEVFGGMTREPLKIQK